MASMVAEDLSVATRERDLRPKLERLLEAATSDRGSDDVHFLAARTGMSAEEVKALLHDEAYHAHLRREAWILMTHSMLRGLKAMEKIAGNRKEKGANRIAAHRAIAHTFQVASMPQQKPQETPAEETMRFWLDKHANKDKESNERTGSARPHPKAS